jgi:glycosyltransferase involved in cell wall biosynthesis
MVSSSKPFLSVIIPAYNEADNFKKGVLSRVEKYLNQQSYKSEVIVVDDGSQDNTAKLVSDWIKDKKRWRIIRNSHKGKAIAVSAGVFSAKGKYIIFTDFDQATPLSEIEKLLPFMKKGYAIAIGSREVKGSKREREPWHRHLMGRAFNLLVKTFAVKGIQDTQCGFKLFKADIAHELFRNLEVYKDAEEKQAYMGAFDVEILYLAQKNGYQTAEVPVHWKHVKTTRLNPVRDSSRMLIDIMKIRLADLTGKYEEKK